jgi:glycosyltransferase involved in cell wall biosynthesis
MDNPEISLDAQKFPGWESQVNDKELKMMKQLPFDDAPTLAITLPNQWTNILCDDPKGFYGYCVWEGSNVPRSWLDLFVNPKVTKILVPSTHTEKAIYNTIVEYYGATSLSFHIISKKIVLCPHGVNHDLFKPMPKKFNDNTFRFICNKGWARGLNDRGGVQFAVKAFNAEFTKDEPVEMFIKVNPAYCDQNWNLKNEIEKLELRENGGRLTVSTDAIEYSKLPEFYTYGDVFVSPNMSESFGLPMLESMACGVPVIATNYGGQTDFVNNKNGWLIESTPVEVTWDVMYEGVKWATPDMVMLRHIMREMFECQGIVKEKGTAAFTDSMYYSWIRTADIILKEIKNS